MAEVEASDRRAWKEWLLEDFAAGASRAHAYSRLPQEVLPTAADVPGAAMSSTPEALLDEQRRKYGRMWRPADGPYTYHWNNVDELPLITPDEMREASRSFKRRTARTYDGFHPRHFAELSDGALRTLALIFQAVEITGRWPRQLRLVMTALLPKPKGGYRPIGILPAPYRLWAKIRRRWTDQWELENARSYLSSAKGNGSLDTLWRLSARQEAGTVGEDQAVVVAEDLAAFFETVDRHRIMEEAEAMGYPAPILRGALGAYSLPRMLTLQGRVSREMHPTVGVIAGCSLAMSLTKLFYVRAIDRLSTGLPATVSLDVHVDDFTLSAIGPPRVAAADIVMARDKLGEVMKDLGCSFAEGKTAITATTRKLASEVARRLGVDGAVSATACILGVDSTAAAPRKRIRAHAKKAQRLRAALARRQRLAHLRRVLGSRTGHIFRTGVLPAASYDAAVWGVTDAEAARLRRLAAVAMSPKAKGRSLTATHLWHNLPTAEAELAPALMYAKMVWKAVTRRREAEMRRATLADIRSMWEAAHGKVSPLIIAANESMRTDGTLPPRVARRLWNEASGPIAAAAITLNRVGWRFQSAFVLVGPDGGEITLTTTSPALTRDTLRDAMRASFERKVATRLAATDPAFTNRRACLDLAIAASRPGKKVTRQQSAVFRAVACDAIWTATRAKELGYMTDGLCDLCGSAPDTVRHRTYECPHTRAAVIAAVPRWFWSEACRHGAHGPFWTSAIIPHPCDTAPRPRPDTYCEVEHHITTDRSDDDTRDLMKISGRVYADGSCAPSPIRGLARASGALVMTSDDGTPIKTLQLAVPGHLPQTSQAAENFIMAVAFGALRGAAELVGDCYSVVRSFAASAARALTPSRKYAGLVLASYAHLDARRMTALRWTRAHRTLTGNESAEEKVDIAGNAAADKAAKEALALHPPLGNDAQAEVDYYARRAPHVVAAVTAAMQFFPRAKVGMQRAPPPTNADEARRAKRHLWEFTAGTWRCRACDAYTTARTIPPYRHRQKCDGKGMAEMAAGFAEAGHTLVRAESGLPIVLCTSCGAWGNKRTRKLGQPCCAPTKAGQQAVKRALAGWHPLIQQAGGGEAPRRARLRITAAYDAFEGAWRPFDPTTPATGGRTDAESCADDAAAAVDQLDHAHVPIDTEGCVMDPALALEVYDDYDVFDHGGALDQQECAEQNGCRASQGDAAMPQAEQAICGRPMERPPTRRRRYGVDDATSPRDHVARAVQQLGDSLSRRDTDPKGRMERLRRRVMARIEAADDITVHTADAALPRGVKRDAVDQGEEERATRRGPPRRGDGAAVGAATSLAGTPTADAASSEEPHVHRGSRLGAPGDDHRADHRGAVARAHSPEFVAAVDESVGLQRPQCGPAPGDHGPVDGPAVRHNSRYCFSEDNKRSSQTCSGGVGPRGIGGARVPTAVGLLGGSKRGPPAGDLPAPPAARLRVDGGRASDLGGNATGANAIADADARDHCRSDAARPGVPGPRTRAELITALRNATPAHGAVAARGSGVATGAASSSSHGRGGQFAPARGGTAAKGHLHDGPSDLAYGISSAAAAATRVPMSRAAIAITTRARTTASSAGDQCGAQAGPAGGAATVPAIQGRPVPSSASAVAVPQVVPSEVIMGTAAPVRRRITGKQRQVEATSGYPRASTSPRVRDAPSPSAQPERPPE